MDIEEFLIRAVFVGIGIGLYQIGRHFLLRFNDRKLRDNHHRRWGIKP